MALLGALLSAELAVAAASVRTWRAPVGNGWPTQQAASNGHATLELSWTGGGQLHLDLKNLLRNTAYSVTLFKGPFIASGSSWSSRGVVCADLSDGPVVRLPPMTTSAEGTIVRSIGLSATRMTAINKLRRYIAITVGSGRLARCGGFQLLTGGSSAPPPSPAPTEAPYIPTGSVCSAWPAAIVAILRVLSTPDGLCLVRYASDAEAPPFMQAFDGLYFSGPPTVLYVARTAAGEVPALAHEVCHAHQDRVTHDESMTDFLEDWYRSPPGSDYLETTGWRLLEGRWVEGSTTIPKRPEGVSDSSSPLEDSAGTCAIWFDEALGPHFLRRWAPTRFAWAQRWLPLPPFVDPWQGGIPSN